jgi:putative membrane protein
VNRNLTAYYASWQFKALLLIIIFAVGLLGFMNFIHINHFEKLTPFNLLFSLAVMLSHHKSWNRNTVLFLIIIFLAGYFIELLGVKTGLIFGSYQYGESLGIKLFDVPLMIGINWVLLVYATGVVAQLLPFPVWLKIITASLLMVLLDFFIEPFAMQHDLWNWQHNIIPLKNYIGWLFSALLMQALFFTMKIEKENTVAVWLYACQLFFFIILYIHGS